MARRNERRNDRRDDRDDNRTSIIPATRSMPFEGQVATAAEDISADKDGSFVRFRMVRKARSRNGYEDELWNTVVVSYPYAQGVLNSLTDEDNNFKKFRVVGEGALELNVYENKDGDLVSEYQIRADWIGASFIFGATYEPPEREYYGNDDDEDEDDRRNSRRGRKKSRRDDDDEDDDDDDEDEEEERSSRRRSTKKRSASSRRSRDEDDEDDDDDEEEGKPKPRRSSRRSSRARSSRVESHGDDEDEELDD